MHSIQSVPKKVQRFYAPRSIQEAEPLCALHHGEGDISPCSHFDHCERPAVIWIFQKDMAPCVYGLCNLCYSFCFPAPKQWYRVVGLSPDFRGML